MNKKTVKRTIIILLCVCLAFSALTACNKKTASKKKKSNKQNTVNVTSQENSSDSSEVEDDLIDTDSEEVETDPDSLEDNEEPGIELQQYNGKFFNGSAPVINTYRGVGGAIYNLYTYMPYKNKANAFTEREAQEQFNRMQKIGVQLVRSDYNTYMNYVSTTKSWDFQNTEYMKAFIKEGLELKKRNIDIAITPGWCHQELVDHTGTIFSSELYVQPKVYDKNGKYLTGENMYYSYKSGNKYTAEGKVMTQTEWKQAMMEGFEASNAKWIKWMEDSILTLRAKGLTNLNTIAMFTEPCTGPWTAERRLHNYECYVISCKTMDAMLKKVGLRSQFTLVGPDTAVGSGVKDNIPINYDFKYLEKPEESHSECLAYMLENAADYLDVFSSHTYFRADDPTQDTFHDEATMYASAWMNTMKLYGSKKEFWCDEWAVAITGRNYSYHESPMLGSQIAACMIALQEQGVSGGFYWSLYNQQWPNNLSTGGEFVEGIQMTGMAYTLQLSTIPATQYYSYAMLSRFYKNMNIVYKSEYEDASGVYFSMIGNKNGGTTITVVNNNSDKVKTEFALQKSLNGATLYRHVYNSVSMKKNGITQVIPADRVYGPVNSKLVDVLEPYCVAVYTTEKLS